MTGAEELLDFRLAGATKAQATPRGLRLLKELGLTSLSEVLDYAAAEVVVAGGHRRVRRLHDSAAEIYLKQSFRGGSLPLWRRLWPGAPPHSSSGIEVQNYQRLAALGIGHPEVLVWGEKVVAGQERGSFLVTTAAQGEDLETFLLGSPNRSEVQAAMTALAQTIRVLGDAQWIFRDFVSKHIFLAARPDASMRIELIDLHRCEPATDAVAVVELLLILDAELPRSLCSRGRRLAFLRQLERLVKQELLGAFLAARQRTPVRRRARRRQLMSRAALEQRWQFEETGEYFVDPDRAQLVADLLGAEARSPAGLVLAQTRAANAGYELLLGTMAELREIFHAHYYLAGRLPMPAVLARRIVAKGPSFLLREELATEPLLTRLGESLQVSNDLLLALRRALNLLQEGGFAPQTDILSALGIAPEIGLVFRPAVTRKKALSPEELGRQLATELAQLGASPADQAEFLTAVRSLS